MEPSGNEYVELAVQQAAPIRTENVAGTTYKVVPAVLVQSQVLNNNLGRTFLPLDRITDGWANASNDAPVVLDHPTSRGVAISARSRDVLNARGLGRVYNVRVESGTLRGDVYLDPSRASAVPELGTILGNLEAGRPTELSTGFPVEVLRTPGVHNGEAFDVVIHPTGPLDHLAVFADKRGACSVKDGCGLGVNCGCDKVEAPKVTLDFSNFPVAKDPLSAARDGEWQRFLEASLFTALPSALPEVPPPAVNEPGNEPQRENATMREKLIAQLTAAGEDAEALNKLSDASLEKLAGQAPAQNQDAPSDSEAMKLAQQRLRRIEELETRYEPVVQNWEKERVRLLDEVLSVNGRPWSDEECMNMKYEELKKIHQALCQRPDYSGRGGPRSFTATLNHDVVPFFGAGGAFSRKEN